MNHGRRILTICQVVNRRRTWIIRKRRKEFDPGVDCREALWRKRVAREERHEAARRRRARFLRQTHPYPSLETFLKLAGLFKRGNANANRFVMKQIPVELDALPPGLDGFRILHVSDFHIGKREPDFPRQVRDFLATVAVDLCVLTGDSRFEHYGDFDHVIEGVRTIVSQIRARHGVLAVLGNHDRSQFVQPYRDMGINVLINQHTRITHNGADLWVAGVDDSHLFECDHLPAALDGVPAGAFKLVLSHTPETALEAAALGAHLFLCGHTHWGQIRFPFLGSIHNNARCPRKFTEGLWRHNGLTGYTTAGIGTTDVPVRYNCPPEAAVITLRKE